MLASVVDAQRRGADGDVNAIDRFELDGVRLDADGNLSLGGSNAARAQVLRLLEDGFLLSEVSDQRYSTRDKDHWPSRRLITAIGRDHERIVALFGAAEWSPIPVEQVASDLAAKRYRYTVQTATGTVAISRRVRAGVLSLTAYEDDATGLRVGRLAELPIR
jgi:hypothetical protein